MQTGLSLSLDVKRGRRYNEIAAIGSFSRSLSCAGNSSSKLAHTRMQASTKPESGEQQSSSIVLRSSHTHNDPHASALTALHSCWLAHTCHPRCVGSAVFVVFMLLWNLFLFVVCSACSSAAAVVVVVA